MRFLITMLASLTLLSLCYFDNPQQAQKLIRQVAYDKELRFSGLNSLSSETIKRELPLERSVLWWILNLREIETKLRTLPTVETATLKRCNSWSIRCFSLEIGERKPALIAVIGEAVWLVGDDGGFVAPLSNEQAVVKRILAEDATLSAEDAAHLAIVRGLGSDNLSPDLIKSRLRYVLNAIEVIESEIQRKVQFVRTKENGELVVRFSGTTFESTFDSTFETPERLHIEATRLKRLLEEYRGAESRLRSIDLAFDRLAVVKLVE